jgi:hypothetical protein
VVAFCASLSLSCSGGECPRGGSDDVIKRRVDLTWEAAIMHPLQSELVVLQNARIPLFRNPGRYLNDA